MKHHISRVRLAAHIIPGVLLTQQHPVWSVTAEGEDPELSDGLRLGSEHCPGHACLIVVDTTEHCQVLGVWIKTSLSVIREDEDSRMTSLEQFSNSVSQTPVLPPVQVTGDLHLLHVVLSLDLEHDDGHGAGDLPDHGTNTQVNIVIASHREV